MGGEVVRWRVPAQPRCGDPLRPSAPSLVGLAGGPARCLFTTSLFAPSARCLS